MTSNAMRLKDWQDISGKIVCDQTPEDKSYAAQGSTGRNEVSGMHRERIDIGWVRRGSALPEKWICIIARVASGRYELSIPSAEFMFVE